MDLCLIVVYYPPQPSKKDRPGYLRVVRLLSDWVGAVLSSLPCRCTPLLFSDVNDGMGVAMGPD
eukprot:2525331-Pyramimonas_sp.AAC.1